jgi:hypothetical protein
MIDLEKLKKASGFYEGWDESINKGQPLSVEGAKLMLLFAIAERLDRLNGLNGLIDR